MELLEDALPFVDGFEEADEVMPYQFRSNPEFDMPFKGMIHLFRHGMIWKRWHIVFEKVPRVMLVGEKSKFVLKK